MRSDSRMHMTGYRGLRPRRSAGDAGRQRAAQGVAHLVGWMPRHGKV